MSFLEILLSLLFAVLIYPGFLFLAILGILFEGLRRKFKARAEGRKGAPLLQPLYDLRKLWRKTTLVTGAGFVRPDQNDDEIYLSETSTTTTKSALYFLPGVGIVALVLASALLAVPYTLYPFRGESRPLGLDLIAVALLFLFPSLVTLLLGTVGGSIYSQLAGSRTAQLFIGFLAPYGVAIGGLAIIFGTVDLQIISETNSPTAIALKLVGGLLYLVAMPIGLRLRPLAISLGEGLEGITTDLNGQPLALFRLMEILERVVSSLLFAVLFVPFSQNPTVFGGAILFYFGGLAIVETLFGQFKLKDALRFYIMYASPIALLWFALLAFVVKL